MRIQKSSIILVVVVYMSNHQLFTKRSCPYRLAFTVNLKIQYPALYPVCLWVMCDEKQHCSHTTQKKEKLGYAGSQISLLMEMGNQVGCCNIDEACS